MKERNCLTNEKDVLLACRVLSCVPSVMILAMPATGNSWLEKYAVTQEDRRNRKELSNLKSPGSDRYAENE